MTGQDDKELAETKRIMERMVRTPPKPHKGKSAERPAGKKAPAKKRGSSTSRSRA